MLREKIPVAREGVPFIGIAALASLVFAELQFAWPAMLALAAVCFILYFFRDPERIVPADTGLAISPADGRVVEIADRIKPPFFEGVSWRCDEFRKIGIFMNVFDVHVNRAPVNGRVCDIAWYPGRFMSADRLSASLENERCAVLLEDSYGRSVIVTQVAGLVARRIVCRLQCGDKVNAGERYGLIRFGSRVDIYLPRNYEVCVGEGERVIAGQTVIGRMQGKCHK
jgi:phosphatidylserine decarboxylase